MYKVLGQHLRLVFKQQQKLNKSILSKVSNVSITGKTNATFSNSLLTQVKVSLMTFDKDKYE